MRGEERNPTSGLFVLSGLLSRHGTLANHHAACWSTAPVNRGRRSPLKTSWRRISPPPEVRPVKTLRTNCRELKPPSARWIGRCTVRSTCEGVHGRRQQRYRGRHDLHPLASQPHLAFSLRPANSVSLHAGSQSTSREGFKPPALPPRFSHTSAVEPRQNRPPSNFALEL
jgi:hypothetical protein